MGSSIRRTDLLALSNLRNDGRRPEEIRRMRVQLGPVSSTTSDTSGEAVGGSALVEMGLTVALATVWGPVAKIPRRGFVCWFRDSFHVHILTLSTKRIFIFSVCGAIPLKHRMTNYTRPPVHARKTVSPPSIAVCVCTSPSACTTATSDLGC